MSTQRGKLLQNFMSPYILLRLEPEPPVPLPCRTFANAWHSAGSLRVTSTTQSMFTLHDHIHTCSPPQCPSVRGLMTVCENLIFETPDVQFVHHRNTLVYLQSTYSRHNIQIVYGSPLDCLWFTPCSVLWTTRRSRNVRSTNSLSTDRILMATTNDYLMDNHRPPKEYFSPLKDIQLFSTSSHCCAQLVSF